MAMPDFQRNAITQAAVVHLNFRAGSTFPVSVCTVSPGLIKQTLNIGLAGATRLTRSDFMLHASYGLNLLLPKGQSCVIKLCLIKYELNIHDLNLQPVFSFAVSLQK